MRTVLCSLFLFISTPSFAADILTSSKDLPGLSIEMELLQPTEYVLRDVVQMNISRDGKSFSTKCGLQGKIYKWGHDVRFECGNYIYDPAIDEEVPAEEFTFVIEGRLWKEVPGDMESVFKIREVEYDRYEEDVTELVGQVKILLGDDVDPENLKYFGPMDLELQRGDSSTDPFLVTELLGQSFKGLLQHWVWSLDLETKARIKEITYLLRQNHWEISLEANLINYGKVIVRMPEALYLLKDNNDPDLGIRTEEELLQLAKENFYFSKFRWNKDFILGMAEEIGKNFEDQYRESRWGRFITQATLDEVGNGVPQMTSEKLKELAGDRFHAMYIIERHFGPAGYVLVLNSEGGAKKNLFILITHSGGEYIEVLKEVDAE